MDHKDKKTPEEKVEYDYDYSRATYYELMDLNKKQKEMTAPTKHEAKQITNNNVFLGSTTDLQRLLQDKVEKVIDVTTNPNAE